MIDKKKKRGFTLIELIITIAIVVAFLFLIFISLKIIDKRKKEEAYKLVIKEIVISGKNYFNDNKYLFEGLDDNSKGLISVGKLVDEDYINIPVDPRTGKKFNRCDQVEVIKKDNKFKGRFVKDKSEVCYTDNSVIVNEIGGPKIDANFYSFDKNNNINKLEQKDWYNTNYLKENEKIMTKIVALENNNGPIKSIIINGPIDQKEVFDSKYEDKKNYLYDGKNIVTTYVAKNLAGKSSTIILSANIDLTKPFMVLKVNNNNWSKDDVSYDVKAFDNMGLSTLKIYNNKTGLNINESNSEKYNWNGKYYNDSKDNIFIENNFKKLNYETKKIFKDDGIRKAKGYVCDIAGNCSYSNEIIAKIDKSTPKPIIKNSFVNKWTNKNLKLIYESKEDLSGIDHFEYSYDNSNWLKASIIEKNVIEEVFTQERKNNLYVKAYDKVGNVSKVTKSNVWIDKTPPVLTKIEKTCLKSNGGCPNKKDYYSHIYYTNDNLSGVKEPIGYNHCYDNANSDQPNLLCKGYETGGKYSNEIIYTSYADRSKSEVQSYQYPKGLKGYYNLFYKITDNAGNTSYYRYKLNYKTKELTSSLDFVGKK